MSSCYKDSLTKYFVFSRFISLHLKNSSAFSKIVRLTIEFISPYQRQVYLLDFHTNIKDLKGPPTSKLINYVSYIELKDVFLLLYFNSNTKFT